MPSSEEAMRGRGAGGPNPLSLAGAFRYPQRDLAEGVIKKITTAKPTHYRKYGRGGQNFASAINRWRPPRARCRRMENGKYDGGAGGLAAGGGAGQNRGCRIKPGRVGGFPTPSSFVFLCMLQRSSLDNRGLFAHKASDGVWEFTWVSREIRHVYTTQGCFGRNIRTPCRPSESSEAIGRPPHVCAGCDIWGIRNYEGDPERPA